MDIDHETAARRVKTQWQMLMLLGVALALFGSYMAVSAAFDDDTVCFAAGSCITVEDTDDIWFGLVMTVVGVAAVLKGRRELVG